VELLEHGPEETFLAAEVVVQGAAGDARELDDLFAPRTRVAALGEEGPGCSQQRGPGRPGAFSLGPAGCHVRKRTDPYTRIVASPVSLGRRLVVVMIAAGFALLALATSPSAGAVRPANAMLSVNHTVDDCLHDPRCVGGGAAAGAASGALLLAVVAATPTASAGIRRARRTRRTISPLATGVVTGLFHPPRLTA
jgi:hypothetical protein